MKYSPSINIELDSNKTLNYIVTANAHQAVGKIVNGFITGVHSFCLVGSYGTGKSSFLLAFENCLKNTGQQDLFNYKGQFNSFSDFEFLNIVGDYAPFVDVVFKRISNVVSGGKNFFDLFESYYQEVQKNNKFLVVVVDEFGKILEHAAKNNPEKEMYFLQQFCEYVNDSDKNILFLSTLHQGFGAYAKDLKVEQRQEWTKVKGRIQDVVFKEPIEQLLNLATTRLSAKIDQLELNSVNRLYQLAVESGFVDKELQMSVAKALTPLDVFSAYVFTLANQKYGQNERSLFTFLDATGEGSISNFVASENHLFHLALIYDYIVYNFHFYLSEVNEDSSAWLAMRTAIGRVEGMNMSDADICNSVALIKVIGLLNLFAKPSMTVDDVFLSEYAQNAMGICNADYLIKRLKNEKIIRFANYKSKYILFDGTDVNIEAGLYNAAIECKPSKDFVEKLRQYFNFKISIANAHYYHTGTPRYFEYHISSNPLTKVVYGETDGFINLLFVPSKEYDRVKQFCLQQTNVAIEYCLFKNSDQIIEHIFEIDKLNWVRDCYVADVNDKVANREINNQIGYEQSVLNRIVLDSIYSDNVEWIFNGEVVERNNQNKLSRFISHISDKIYYSTPTFKNELVNKQKLSGNNSSARRNFVMDLLENQNVEDIGLDKGNFPPEKTIYMTLLKGTGIHREEDGVIALYEPKEESFKALWEACESFLQSTASKQKKIGELIKILQEPPFRLKQGLIDCWLPTFLIAKKDDFALYSGDTFVPNFNKDILDLLQKTPNSFSIKAFSVDGVKYAFFEKYREAINLKDTQINSSSFIETIKPFFIFYNHMLNNYAKTTKDLSTNARKFRDVIARATDPEKTFFETLPEELGFREIVITQNPEAIDGFVSVIQEAIRDLRNCYDDFVLTIERKILSILKIEQTDFTEYKSIIDRRYKLVKVDLMPMTVRNFYSRLIGKYTDRKSWIESVCYVILNKQLSDIKDSDKTFLFVSLQDKLFQLDDYVEMHTSTDDSVVRLHITQNKKDAITKQVVVPKEKESDVADLETKLEALLSADDSVNMAALIKIIEKKLK
ncbi:MAG: hypothetical protein KBT57_08455 [bacterium]|nr:hypothetical protein [Candidatus Limimorpha equi]